MKAPDFDYQRPESLIEALDLLARHGDEAALIAGGQSLLALLNFRLSAPPLLIDIGRLAELRQLKEVNGAVELGGLLRHADLESNELVSREFPLLVQAVAHIAHPAIRHRGTIGGSLALADPAAELGACCLALDGAFVLTSARGERSVAAEDFFRGIYATALASDEILTTVRLPKNAPDTISVFDEVTRRRGDFAIAGLALVCQVESDRLKAVRIALLGVADRPILAHQTMALLEDQDLDEAKIEEAGIAIASEIEPPLDPAYPPGYRRHLASVLLRRALQRVMREAAA